MVSRAAVRAFGVGMLVAAFSVVMVSGAAATPSGPGPGNSPNAKQCQNGGWQNLVTSTGESFANEGACTSYAAHGGTLAPRLTDEQEWHTICQNAGGSFILDGNGVTSPFNGWLCDAPEGGGLSLATADSLSPTCFHAGGTPFGYVPWPADYYSYLGCSLPL